LTFVSANKKKTKTKEPPRAGRTSKASVRFRTTLNQAEGKSATGVIIPDDLIEKLGHGKRPPVRVKVNGYEYRTTVGVMGGRAMVGVSAAIRKETGLAAGDKIEVELVVDQTPRDVDVPADFAKALAGNRATREFFDGLPNSLQRYHVDNVNAAKTDETRQRRIDKAVALFRARKKR
jgi:antitoxin component of MazEF toxin-antitoxin module